MPNAPLWKTSKAAASENQKPVCCSEKPSNQFKQKRNGNPLYNFLVLHKKLLTPLSEFLEGSTPLFF
jgi:hypothetical protein